MKKRLTILRTLLVAMLAVITLPLNAAEHEYKPLVEEGKAWWYNYKVTINWGNVDVKDRGVMLKIEGTKEIDGKEWHGLNFYCDGAYDATVAYLYEDVDNHRVYIKREDIKRYVICDDWFFLWDEGILYDFDNAEMEIIPDFCEGRSAVEVVSNGKSYSGWACDDSLLPIAAVEGLGLIPYSEDVNNSWILNMNATLLGFVCQVAGGEAHIYPFLYKITDKDGNVLYEIKENEFASVDALDGGKMSVRVEGRTIRVDNPAAVEVAVTDAAGVQLLRSADASVSVEVTPGVYIVSGAGDAKKVIVR